MNEMTQKDSAIEVEELRRQVTALQEYTIALTAMMRRYLLSLPSIAESARWNHLVVRQHPWRKQLYIKGRNMTVRQLVGTVKANQLGEEDAAKNLDLPVEAIREALLYAEENAELLDFEAAYERLFLVQKGYGSGVRPLP